MPSFDRDGAPDFSALIESVRGIVWEVDPETGRFRFVSQQAERLLGYPVKRWLEEPDFWPDHMHPDDRNWAPGFCRAETQMARPHEFEYRMIAADGRTVWLRDICSVVVENERPVSLRGVMVDVTERRAADEAVRVATRRLRAVIGSAPVVLIAMDRDGVVTLCEGRGLQAAGVDPRELIGRRMSDWARGTLQVRSQLRRALAGEPFAARVEFEGRSFEARYTPIRDDAGRPDGLIAVATDVTEHVRSEAERKALEAQVHHSQKLESLGVLAGGVAHDFNNLLTTVLGSGDLLLAEIPVGSAGRQHVERIQRAARTAADLTHQLLAYTGKGSFDVRPIDLPSLIAELEGLLRISVSKCARLHWELSDDLPAIEADSTQVTQVILNLVINASDSLEGGDGRITVRTGVAQMDEVARSRVFLGEQLADGPHVFVEVSDSGVGMDAETQSKIFDPFFTTKFVGRGLGLASVLGIVRGHGGAVSVASTPGTGTVVRVLFPASAGCVRPTAATAVPEPREPSGGTVLVVDDEPDVRDLTGELLRRLGFEVVMATSGDEAVALFRARPAAFDAVLLDATMPGLSGEQTLREMLRIRSDARIVLMSGYRMEDARRSPGDTAIAGYLQKPFSGDELAIVLNRVLAEGGGTDAVSRA
jgi:PAS domain S-box-containing protein